MLKEMSNIYEIRAAISSSEVGGRLQFFADNWAHFLRNGSALRSVTDGLMIDFIKIPYQKAPPLAIAMSDEMIKIGNIKVADF